MHYSELQPEWLDTFTRANEEFVRMHRLIITELTQGAWPANYGLEQMGDAFSVDLRETQQGMCQEVIGASFTRERYALTWRLVARLRANSFYCTAEASIRDRHIEDEANPGDYLSLARFSWPKDAGASAGLLRNPYCLSVHRDDLPAEVTPAHLMKLLPEGEARTVLEAKTLLSISPSKLREGWRVPPAAGELVLHAFVRAFKQVPAHPPTPMPPGWTPRIVIVQI